MPKSSRVDAERHRQEIIDVASRFLRERGEAAVSVQAVMGEVGLTHGGFYKHFSSKDELMNLAAQRAFSGLIDDMNSVLAESPTAADAWTGFVEGYLSPEQQKDLGGGCASTALASDSARAGTGSGIRGAYVHGVTETLDALKQYQELPETPSGYQRRLQALISMVGALTLARATAGTPVAEDFVEAATILLIKGNAPLVS